MTLETAMDRPARIFRGFRLCEYSLGHFSRSWELVFDSYWQM